MVLVVGFRKSHFLGKVMFLNGVMCYGEAEERSSARLGEDVVNAS